MSEPWFIIHNPKSASGRGAVLREKAEALLKAAGVDYRLESTQFGGHASHLAQAAVENGHRKLIAFGGDGTVNEVVNGIHQSGLTLASEVILTQFPTGTGNDWRRTHGIPTKASEWPSMLIQNSIITQDVGIVRWQESGLPKERCFVNIAGLGFESYAGLLANTQKAQGKGGVLSYVAALLKSLHKYQAEEATINLDHRFSESTLLYSAAIGICKYNGGGMKQCPDADPDDGLFDFTRIGQISKLDVIRNIPGLFSGKFVKHPSVAQHRAKRIEVSGPKPILLEVDGENIGASPCVFEMSSLKLRVAVPKR